MTLKQAIDGLISLGLVEEHDGIYRLTRKGREANAADIDAAVSASSNERSHGKTE